MARGWASRNGSRYARAGGEFVANALVTETSFGKGDRVETSGQGRTARWPYGQATVTRASFGGNVFVIWDGTSFEDQMDSAELRKVQANV